MTTSTNLVRNLWLLSLFILIFLVPSNLFLVLTEQSGYVTGLRVDYLLPKLYLSDLAAWVFIILSMLLWQQDNSLTKKFNQLLHTSKQTLHNSWAAKTLLVTTLMLMLFQFFTPLPVVSFWFIAHLITAGLVGWSLYVNHAKLNTPVVMISLMITVIFQTALASYQFLLQRSLVGYQLLGEVALSKPFGIAHTSFGGTDQVLAYGTTAHPNVLAGVVVIFSLLMIKWRHNLPKLTSRILSVISLISAGTVLFTTQSLSALMAMLIGLLSIYIWESKQRQPEHWLKSIAKLFQKTKFQIPHWLWLALLIMIIWPIILLLLLQFYPDNLSLARRVWLNTAAVQILTHNIAVGTGLNQFTRELAATATTNEIVRFNQPVHHVGLLWLAETGTLGLIWLGSLFAAAKRSLPWNKLVVVVTTLLPIILLDHYLFSLQTGRLLVVIFGVLMTIDHLPRQK